MSERLTLNPLSWAKVYCDAFAIYSLHFSFSFSVISSQLFQFVAPLVLTNGDYSTLFTTDQWLAQVQFFIDMQVQGDKAAQIFTLWVILLGFLMYKSGYVPKLLGILMMIAGVGYMADFLVFFLLPQLDVQLAGLAFLAEVAFPFWLLIKGIDIEAWISRLPGKA